MQNMSTLIVLQTLIKKLKLHINIAQEYNNVNKELYKLDYELTLKMTQESFEYDRQQNKTNYEANIIGDIETLISVIESGDEDEFVYDRVGFFFFSIRLCF